MSNYRPCTLVCPGLINIGSLEIHQFSNYLELRAFAKVIGKLRCPTVDLIVHETQAQSVLITGIRELVPELPAQPFRKPDRDSEIGRASCRESVWMWDRGWSCMR